MPGFLYRKAVLALWKFAREKGIKKNGLIGYPEASAVLNHALNLGKDDSFKVFKELAKEGVLVESSCHGIRLIVDESTFL